MAGQALHLYLVLEGGAAPLILAFLEPCGRPAPLPPIFSRSWRLIEVNRVSEISGAHLHTAKAESCYSHGSSTQSMLDNSLKERAG